MPAGLVIAALAVIALVALAALFLFARPADSAPPPVPRQNSLALPAEVS